MRLVDPAEPVRVPTQVRVSWSGGASPPLPVGRDGRVTLPRPIRSRKWRLDILAASPRPGASAADRRAVGIAEVRGLDPRVRLSAPSASPVGLPCASVTASVGARTIPMRITAPAATFASGTPMHAVACSPAITLARGRQTLLTRPGVLLVDRLRLSSPSPRRAPIIDAGSVLDSGRAGRGRVDHVRIAARGPSWLILGEGYDRGWRASCDGRSLGSPRVVDGYANGWRVGSGCRAVRFFFAPNRLALAGYAVSALAALVCMVLLGLTRAHRRREVSVADRAEIPDASVAHPLPRACLFALAGASGYGFLFGPAAGVIALPVLTFVLWRGVGARPLTLAAAGLLVVVIPVLYLGKAAGNAGANNFTYATAHIAAHWAGVGALGLLSVALGWTLRAARASSPTSPDQAGPGHG